MSNRGKIRHRRPKKPSHIQMLDQAWSTRNLLTIWIFCTHLWGRKTTHSILRMKRVWKKLPSFTVQYKTYLKRRKVFWTFTWASFNKMLSYLRKRGSSSKKYRATRLSIMILIIMPPNWVLFWIANRTWLMIWRRSCLLFDSNCREKKSSPRRSSLFRDTKKLPALWRVSCSTHICPCHLDVLKKILIKNPNLST